VERVARGLRPRIGRRDDRGRAVGAVVAAARLAGPGRLARLGGTAVSGAFVVAGYHFVFGVVPKASWLATASWQVESLLPGLPMHGPARMQLGLRIGLTLAAWLLFAAAVAVGYKAGPRAVRTAGGWFVPTDTAAAAPPVPQPGGRR